MLVLIKKYAWMRWWYNSEGTFFQFNQSGTRTNEASKMIVSHSLFLISNEILASTFTKDCNMWRKEKFKQAQCLHSQYMWNCANIKVAIVLRWQ